MCKFRTPAVATKLRHLADKYATLTCYSSDAGWSLKIVSDLAKRLKEVLSMLQNKGVQSQWLKRFAFDAPVVFSILSHYLPT
jgi:hypothetical protein